MAGLPTRSNATGRFDFDRLTSLIGEGSHVIPLFRRRPLHAAPSAALFPSRVATERPRFVRRAFYVAVICQTAIAGIRHDRVRRAGSLDV